MCVPRVAFLTRLRKHGSDGEGGGGGVRRAEQNQVDTDGHKCPAHLNSAWDEQVIGIAEHPKGERKGVGCRSFIRDGSGRVFRRFDIISTKRCPLTLWSPREVMSPDCGCGTAAGRTGEVGSETKPGRERVVGGPDPREAVLSQRSQNAAPDWREGPWWGEAGRQSAAEHHTSAAGSQTEEALFLPGATVQLPSLLRGARRLGRALAVSEVSGRAAEWQSGKTETRPHPELRDAATQPTGGAGFRASARGIRRRRFR